MNLNNYDMDLLRPEWESKRNSILNRDNHQCVRCGKKEYEKGFYTTLNVHHLLYIPNRRLWEYDDEDLITLCRNCHKKEHNLIQVNIAKDTFQIDWKKHNSKLLSEEIIPQAFYIKVIGFQKENQYEYLRKSFSNYYYEVYLSNSPFIQKKGEMRIFVEGRRNFIFQKESIYTFLLIHNSLSNGNFKIIDEISKADRITLGYNDEIFYPIVIWGTWIKIDAGFDFYETDKNNEVFKEIRREGNDYVSKPKTSNSFDFFLEQHHFNDLEYIVENKIIERIPFMVEQ